MLPAPVFSISILAICCSKPLVPGLTKPCTRRLPVALLGLLTISLWRPTIPSLWRTVTLGWSIASWWAIVWRRLPISSICHSLWSVTTILCWLLCITPIHGLLTKTTLGLAVTIAWWRLAVSSLAAVRILAVHGAGWRAIGVFLPVVLLAVTRLTSKRRLSLTWSAA